MEEKLTLKQKDSIARKIYKTYQRAQLDILYLNQHYNYYPQVDMFKVKDTSSFYQKGDEKMNISIFMMLHGGVLIIHVPVIIVWNIVL